MNLDFRDTIVKSIEHRLQQKLPIQTKEGEEYFRDRFYWLVDKFKEKYFVDGKKLDTNSILDEIFSSIKSDVDNLNLSKLHDFKIAFARGFIEAANKFHCSLKVTPFFFQDQFLSETDQRFKIQYDTVMEYTGILSNALTNEGIDQDKAMKIIEAGVSSAETTQCHLTPVEFLAETMLGIIDECEEVIDQRFQRQSHIVTDFVYFLSQIVINASLNKNKAMKIIEAGDMVAESIPPYDCCPKEFFLMKIIEGILSVKEQTFLIYHQTGTN